MFFLVSKFTYCTELDYGCSIFLADIIQLIFILNEYKIMMIFDVEHILVHVFTNMKFLILYSVYLSYKRINSITYCNGENQNKYQRYRIMYVLSWMSIFHEWGDSATIFTSDGSHEWKIITELCHEWQKIGIHDNSYITLFLTCRFMPWWSTQTH